MPTRDSEGQRSLESDFAAAQKLFSSKASAVVHALYQAGGPVGFGDLLAAVNATAAAAVSEPTLTRLLLVFEEMGAVNVLTNRPPGQRRGVAVLYSLDRDRVDALIGSYVHWMRANTGAELGSD